MKDLTKGNPSRLLIAFALPIFFGNLLQLTYSIADTRIVGTFLGENALAAVGSTTTISNLMIGFLMGVTNGFAIITAQCFGAGNKKGVRKSFAASLMLGTMIAVILTAGGLIFLNQILSFLNVPQMFFKEAKQYIFIILAGTIVTLLYDVLLAVMRAVGDTVTPLMILLLSVVLNVAGDWILIAKFHAGVWGAAAATVMAQVIALLVCGVYLVSKYEIFRLKKEDFFEQNRIMQKNMLASGLSMGFMSSLVNIGSLTLQTAINKLGQDIIVAHTAARKITEIFMILFSVFGQTMATYCGQNMGAGNSERIIKGIKISMIYTCIWCTMTMIASYTIGRWLVYLVTGSRNPVVVENAVHYLKFDTVFYYMPAAIAIIRNAMQGIGDRITPLISSTLEMAGKIIIAATLVPWLGYMGVIVTEPIVWFVMLIPLLMQYFRNPIFKRKKQN
jgi:putative MATE family efflux protein